MTGHTMVEHHTHYKEIHGFDRTVWMEPGEHFKLHRRLRKEGKCNIPLDKLHKISTAACMRTDKVKKYNALYLKNNVQNIDFHESFNPFILLRERIRYNQKTGNVTCTADFLGSRGYLIPVINIEAQARVAISAPETKEEIQDVESEFYPDTVKEEST